MTIYMVFVSERKFRISFSLIYFFTWYYVECELMRAYMCTHKQEKVTLIIKLHFSSEFKLESK